MVIDMISIGLYKENTKDSSLPSIYDDINRFTGDKNKVLQYMKKCRVLAAAPSILHDVITGQPIHKELTFMTDGVYGWRSDIIYYVENYDLRLPDDFMRYVTQ